MPGDLGWLTTHEALARLKVRPQTLYAYVSRGRVQTKPAADDPRRRLYSEPDVERLARSSRAARRPSAVAASSIAWGEPILRSAISTVRASRLLYRGRDAVDWSGTATLEDVAALLWNAPRDLLDEAGAPTMLAPGARATKTCLSMLAHSAARTEASINQDEDERWRTAAATLRDVGAACGAGEWRANEPVHVYLARRWRAPAAADVLRRALVLLADHELNVSTFAARVIASTGSPLPACVLSGLCALLGPRRLSNCPASVTRFTPAQTSAPRRCSTTSTSRNVTPRPAPGWLILTVSPRTWTMLFLRSQITFDCRAMLRCSSLPSPEPQDGWLTRSSSSKLVISSDLARLTSAQSGDNKREPPDGEQYANRRASLGSPPDYPRPAAGVEAAE